MFSIFWLLKDKWIVRNQPESHATLTKSVSLKIWSATYFQTNETLFSKNLRLLLITVRIRPNRLPIPKLRLCWSFVTYPYSHCNRSGQRSRHRLRSAALILIKRKLAYPVASSVTSTNLNVLTDHFSPPKHAVHDCAKKIRHYWSVSVLDASLLCLIF